MKFRLFIYVILLLFSCTSGKHKGDTEGVWPDSVKVGKGLTMVHNPDSSITISVDTLWDRSPSNDSINLKVKELIKVMIAYHEADSEMFACNFCDEKLNKAVKVENNYNKVVTKWNKISARWERFRIEDSIHNAKIKK